MRRGIFLQSLISSSGSERPGILEQALNGAREIIKQGGLEALFSRAETITGETGRLRTPEQLAAFRNVGRIIQQETFEERAKRLWANAGKRLAQGLFDQFRPIRDLNAHAYTLMRLTKGASGAFQVLMQGGQLKLSDGVYDFDEAHRGGVLDRLLTPLQGEADDFFWWIAANRAENLSQQDREHLFAPADIAALKTLNQGEMPFDYALQYGPNRGKLTRNRAEIYRDALQTFNEFNKNTLDLAEQSGLIDPDGRKYWESEFYVPFYRVMEDETGGVRGLNIKQGVVRQQAFKHLKGGREKLNTDLLENVLLNWAHLLDAAAKNRAAAASLNAAEQVGIAHAVSEGTKNAVWYMGRVERVIPAGQKYEEDGVEKISDGTATINFIGKKHYLVDDPLVFDAITALEYAGFKSPLMTAMSKFKHALTLGVTASPFFKTRNLVRDSLQSIAVSGLSYNALANVKEGWKLTNPESDAYFRLLAGGGTIHFGTMLEGNESKRVRALVEKGVKASTILDNETKVMAFYHRVIEPVMTAYNELGNRGEAVNRAALYNQLINPGEGKQGMSHAEASLMARDLMDFSMQGTWNTIRFLTQVVPFFNARLQGLYKLGRAAGENPQKFSIVLGATAMASIALMLAYSDDDDWKKREDWDRENYWWFKIGGEAFRIPKPFEIGAIATLAERGVELFSNPEMTGKRFGERFWALLGNQLAMNPIPQVVKPIVDVYANRDSFTGRPIETMGMERLEPEYRYSQGTSLVARAASTALLGAASPVQIDHLIRGYFGWLGSTIVTASESIPRRTMGAGERRPAMDMWKWATGMMVSGLADAPSRYVTAMYDQAQEIEQAYGTWRYLQRYQPEEAEPYRKANIDKLRQYKRVEAVKRAESALNLRIRLIEHSTKSADEKREVIRRLNVQKDLLARRISAASVPRP